MLRDDFSSSPEDGSIRATSTGDVMPTYIYETIPDDPRGPMDPSGIRLGTPALTTRGMKEEEMRHVAEWIDRAITNWQNPTALVAIRDEVKSLTAKFPLYLGLEY